MDFSQPVISLVVYVNPLGSPVDPRGFTFGVGGIRSNLYIFDELCDYNSSRVFTVTRKTFKVVYAKKNLSKIIIISININVYRFCLNL